MKKIWKLSASFISSFKACPVRCYNKYVLGVVPVEDTDALRTGTNWHRILEIMGMRPETVCPDCCNKGKKDPECPLCNGTDILPEDMMDSVVRELNRAYANRPLSKTEDEWLAERAVLLYSIAGYNWRYEDDPFEVVAEEIEFSIPVRNLATGRALPNVEMNGKIDKLVRSPNGTYYVDEHKSTSKSVDPDSMYWKHLRLDTQTRLYVYAAQQLQLAGELEEYGIKATDPLIRGVRYDAWHKPGIKPKKLTQADSKKFVEDGEYCGEKFEVVMGCDVPQNTAKVNDSLAEVEPGKKEGTFTIRETPDMYGARLLQDIGERPEFYFCRKEIPRTDADILKFAQEIYNMYHTIKFMDRNCAWWGDEDSCESKYKCQYVDLCYNNVDLSNGDVPEGFKLLDWKKKELEEN